MAIKKALIDLALHIVQAGANLNIQDQDGR